MTMNQVRRSVTLAHAGSPQDEDDQSFSKVTLLSTRSLDGSMLAGRELLGMLSLHPPSPPTIRLCGGMSHLNGPGSPVREARPLAAEDTPLYWLRCGRLDK